MELSRAQLAMKVSKRALKKVTLAVFQIGLGRKKTWNNKLDIIKTNVF